MHSVSRSRGRCIEDARRNTECVPAGMLARSSLGMIARCSLRGGRELHVLSSNSTTNLLPHLSVALTFSRWLKRQKTKSVSLGDVDSSW